MKVGGGRIRCGPGGLCQHPGPRVELVPRHLLSGFLEALNLDFGHMLPPGALGLSPLRPSSLSV